jgi:hypothetical protein
MRVRPFFVRLRDFLLRKPFYRDGWRSYACKTKLIPLMEVANVEKKIPREWINAEGNGVNHQFIEYALPLIQGEPDLPKVDSLPRFAKLKKILAK